MAVEEDPEDSKDTKMEIDKESKEDLIQVGAYTGFIIHNSLFEHYIETVIFVSFSRSTKNPMKMNHPALEAVVHHQFNRRTKVKAFRKPT